MKNVKVEKRNSLENTENINVKRFRYVCPACTNTAFESTNKMVGTKMTCQKCNKEFITIEENYIKL